jgi:hypothetical protein
MKNAPGAAGDGRAGRALAYRKRRSIICFAVGSFSITRFDLRTRIANSTNAWCSFAK